MTSLKIIKDSQTRFSSDYKKTKGVRRVSPLGHSACWEVWQCADQVSLITDFNELIELCSLNSSNSSSKDKRLRVERTHVYKFTSSENTKHNKV